MRRALLLSLAVFSCAPSQRTTSDRVSLWSQPFVRASLRAPSTISPIAGGHALDVAPLGARVSRGALRIAASTDAWLELAPVDDSARTPSIEHGALIARDARTATDVLWIGARGRVEELRVLYDERAPKSTRYRVTHGPGIAAIRVHDGRVNALDDAGRAVLAGERLIAVDADSVSRDLVATLEGDLLTITLDAAGLRYPIVIDPAWTAVSSMSARRSHHTVSLLSDGKAIAIGGTSNGSTNVSTSEIYDPVANAWSAGPAMSAARAFHTATPIAGGKLLVAGGSSSTAEIYTPGGAFAATGAMSTQRSLAGAVALPSGKVLITGGQGSSGMALSATELFDPATGTFSPAASMSKARSGHGAFVLPSGKVVVVGTSEAVLAGGPYAELYDPTANTWSDASLGVTARTYAIYGQLGDGRVLVAGGNSTSYGSTAETFDGTKWSATDPLPRARMLAFTATLSSGALLVMGGDPLNAVDTFDPTSGKWSNAANMITLREWAATVRLLDGRVLVTGGEFGDVFSGATYLSEAEVFAGEKNGTACSKGGDCTSGACADGVCCDRGCTGQCEACDLPGKVGACSFVTGAPRGGRATCAGAATCSDNSFTAAPLCDGTGKCSATPRDCGGFKCTSEACRTACTDTSHCAANFTCNAGACIAVANAACEQPGLGASISAGVRTECNAYLCDAGTGLCRDKCSDSSQCAPGFVCGNNVCARQPEASGSGDDGGCAYGGRGSTGLALAIALSAWLARRRRA